MLFDRARRLAKPIGILALLLACQKSPDVAVNNAAASNSAADPPETPIPLPQQMLDREALILATLRAATAMATGTDDRQRQSDLKGAKFELRMRFGCSPAERPSAGHWTFDEKMQVLRVEAKPNLPADQAVVKSQMEQGFESVSGFALDRPWLLAPACPVAAAETAARDEPAIALAQFLTADDSRIQELEPSYRAVQPIDAQALPKEGLDLIVSGRLQLLADGRAVHCLMADGAPQCVISATIGTISIANPTDGAILGTWGH